MFSPTTTRSFFYMSHTGVHKLAFAVGLSLLMTTLSSGTRLQVVCGSLYLRIRLWWHPCKDTRE